MLIAGGMTDTVAALYDPATETFRATATMYAPRYRFPATLLLNGKVLVAGGTRYGFITAQAELY